MEFRKSGFSDEESAQLAQLASLYQNIADEEITAGESASFLIAQMKAFNIDAKDSIHILDAVNEVSNNFAVSSSDLAGNLGKVSSTLSANNVSFEESLGIMTAIVEITRNASTASRGLRQISSRLVQINDSTSSTGKKLKKIYDDLEISVYDSNGQLRSTFDILKDLSEQWDDLDTNTKQYIALTSAGANQIQNFYALMTNFGTAIEATDTAIEAENSAWEENAKYMESIEALTQKLKSSLENMLLGNGGLEKVVKGVLNFAVSCVELVDSLGGLVPVITTLTGVLILLNTKGIMQFAIQFPMMITQIKTGITAYIEFATTVTTANEAITASIPIIGLVIIALSALTAGLFAYANSLENSSKKLKELNEQIYSEKSEIDTLIEQISKLKEKLHDLTQSDKIELTTDEDIQNTAIQLAQLERELAIKKKILDIDTNKQERKANRFLNSGANVFGIEAPLASDTHGAELLGYNAEDAKDTEYFIKGSKSLDERIKVYTNTIVALKEKLTELEIKKQELVEGSEEFEAISIKIISVQNALNQYQDITSYLVSKLSDATELLPETSDAYIRAKEAIDYYADGLLKTRTEEEKIADENEILQSSIQAVIDSHNLNAKQQEELNKIVEEAIENKSDEEDAYEVALNAIDGYIAGIESEANSLDYLNKKWEDWHSGMDDIQSAYETLQSAVDEYNNSQMYSIDTVQSLMELSPDYLDMLEEENGKLKINEEMLINKANAHIQDAKALVYEEGASKLNALAEEKKKLASEETTEALKNETNALKENEDANYRNAKSSYASAIGRARAYGATEEEIKEITDQTSKELKILDSMLDGIGKNFTKSMQSSETATRKAREETSKMKDAVNGLKNKVSELKDEIDKYKTVIDTINDALDKEIDKIGKERDAKLDSIDKQIDALEELQDKEEKYWDEKIQAYKDENEQIEDQLELQKLLDALQTAKQTKIRVYKEGQGFVWDTDTEAVNKAQSELDKYNRKKAYEEGLKELEDYKKKALEQYEAQIQDLKDYRKKEEEEFEKRIKYYQDYKDKFNEQVDEYGNSQNRLLVLQMTGIDLEKENWTERLGNLDDFLLKYKAKLKEAEDAQKALNDAQAKLNSSSEYSSNTSSSGGTTGSTITDKDKEKKGTGKTHYFVMVKK